MAVSTDLTPAQDLTSADYLAERVTSVYQSLSKDNLNELQSLYTSDIYFEDPAHAIQGKEALLEYFRNLFAKVESCKFKFHQSVTNDTDIFLSWTMLIKHPRLKKGETVRVEGASYLKTRNGQVYYHRDYFDMGAMVYEHVPVIGAMIQTIKQRLGR